MRGTVVNAFDLLLSYVGARHSRSSEAALAAALYQPPSIASQKRQPFPLHSTVVFTTSKDENAIHVVL
jgi:hypothetical protein